MGKLFRTSNQMIDPRIRYANEPGFGSYILYFSIRQRTPLHEEDIIVLIVKHSQKISFEITLVTQDFSKRERFVVFLGKCL